MTTYQVAWLPGSDQLLGRCHCGAQQLAEDPIEMWAWLLGHPDDHDPHRPVALRDDTELAAAALVGAGARS